jgi:Schlafen, AlbA_2
MKSVAEWDESYLLNLPTGEHDWLEIKGTKALDFSQPDVKQDQVLNELSKQVSAFSNSGGGTLVYGVTDPIPGQPRAIDDGGVPLVLKGKSTKEWLEDIIPNLVEFPLRRFNVYVILQSSPHSQISNDRCVLLVDLPDSEAAPHQARDKKYYARIGGKSRPISHRMVSDIFSRLKHPTITLLAGLEWDSQRRLVLSVYCRNTGRIYANYVSGFLNYPATINGNTLESVLTLNNPTPDGRRILNFANLHRDIVGIRLGIPAMPHFGKTSGFAGSPPTPYEITRYEPVLPGTTYKVPILSFSTEKQLRTWLDAKGDILRWTLYADSAPEVKSEIKIADIKIPERPSRKAS